MDIQTLILFLVIGMLVWSQVSPTSFTAAKNKLVTQVKAKVPALANTGTPPTTSTGTANFSAPPIIETPSTPPTTTTTTAPTNTTTTAPTPTQEASQTTICARTYGDYPDYFGTEKSGQSCNQQTQPDYACLANPPSWYDGIIDLLKRYSSPQIGCCITDGKCRW